MTRLTSIALAMACVLSPAAAKAYELPLRGSDLAPGERYMTFTHKAGIQAQGRDIGVKYSLGGGKWTGRTVVGAELKVLTNWRVYGKPVYAMAPGRVISCWRNAPDNTPGSLHPSYEAGQISGGGNHLWIEHDDGVRTLYAHLQPGSVPASICPHNAVLMNDKDDDAVVGGARVEAGQMIGRVGNSGATKEGPHLHVHMQKDGKALPMPFDHGMTTPFVDGTTTLEGPWTRLAGKTLPEGNILIWPPRKAGEYVFNGTKAEDYQGLVEHLADSGVMPTLITCTSNGATYDSKWTPSKGLWGTHHGMSPAVAAAKHADYTAKGYARTSSYTCGGASVAVWRK